MRRLRSPVMLCVPDYFISRFARVPIGVGFDQPTKGITESLCLGRSGTSEALAVT